VKKKQNFAYKFKQFRKKIIWIHMDAKSSKKVAEIFHCKLCDYKTCKNSNWKKHLLTRKHERVTNGLQMDDKWITKVAKSSHTCVCGKSYVYRQGLNKHMKTCDYKEKNINLQKVAKSSQIEAYDNNSLLNIIEKQFDIINKQNNNIIEKQFDIINKQNNEIVDLAGKTGSYNNNTINQNINIQLFLDENCKDAMTIQNFVNQLTLKIADLTKNNSITDSMPNILIENLKPLTLTERPLHLDKITDKDNPIWMINDEKYGWKKDTGTTIINNTEYGIRKKFQDLWDSEYPEWENNVSLIDTRIKLLNSILEKVPDKEIDKILKKIGPECKITLKKIKECKT
jgi:hypothetical protein